MEAGPSGSLHPRADRVRHRPHELPWIFFFSTLRADQGQAETGDLGRDGSGGSSDPAVRRPPERGRNWAGPDTLVVLLEDTLSPVERNLVRVGEHQRLRDTRMFLQYATVREVCAAIEQLTGRTVRSLLRGIDTEVDGLSTGVFVLHPVGSTGAARSERAEV